MSHKKYIKVGYVAGVFGIKGELKAIFSNDFSETIGVKKDIKLYDKDGIIIPFKYKRHHSKYVIISIDGLIDRTEAEKYQGTEFFSFKEDLPTLTDDEFYESDLEGLKVFLGNEEVGAITGVFNYGAGDIIEVTYLNGERELLPFAREIFTTIETEKVIIKKPDYS